MSNESAMRLSFASMDQMFGIREGWIVVANSLIYYLAKI